MKTHMSQAIRRALAAALMLCTAGMAQAATTTVALTAQPGTTTLPDGAVVPMWGYCGQLDLANTSSVGATVGTVSCAGGWSVGPTITMPAGDTLVINLTNNLKVETSIVILGQLGGGLGSPTTMASPTHAPQTQTTWPANGAGATFTPPAQGARMKSMATEVAPLGSAALTWANLKPGTYLYETGTLPSLQAPMGLYGTLVVTAPNDANNVKQAYAGVPYDDQAVLLFSEIDPVQNAAVDAAATAGAAVQMRFDDPACATSKCYPAAVNYTPTYFLINGKSFDRASPVASTFAIGAARTSAGNVLVRLLNAGLRSHVPTIIGLPMAIVAQDGNLAPGNPKVQSEVLLTAGKTYDVLVQPPGDTAGTAYLAGSYGVFDRQLGLSTAGWPDGGMQGTLLVAGATAPAAATVSKQTPLAVNDMFVVPVDTMINGNVRANDTAVLLVAQTLPTTLGTTTQGGTIILNPDGSFVYSPPAGFTGVDGFSYIGNNGTTNVAAVSFNVGNAGSGAGGPTAASDQFASALASSISQAGPGVLGNDSDPANLVMTAALLSPGNCASVALKPDGSFTATGSGTCQFTYRAVNSQNVASAPATVTLNFAAGSGLAVAVVDSVDGSAVPDYRWIIQEDLTFKVDPKATPALGTDSLAIRFHKSHMPVVASGCVGPFSCGAGQSVRGSAVAPSPNTLPGDVALDPTKHYYLSVLPGDAAGPTDAAGAGPMHAMGGTELKYVPATAGTPATWQAATVKVPPYPFVPAQLSIFIYEDNAPVNGQNDLNEAGLGGFNIILMDAVGRSGDVAGQQSYDASGMPLSNWLLGRPGCPDDQNTRTNGSATSATGNIVGVVYTCPNAPPGYTGDPAVYALAGHALIKNLTPARYDVIAHPAAARQGAGEVWFQTETLEGTPAQDAFTGVKEPVYFQEFGPPGFHTTIGFMNPAHVAAAGKALVASLPANAPTYTVSGKITNQRMSRPSNVALYDSGSYDLLSSTTCLVALNSQGGTGPGVAFAQCGRDGSFSLKGVAPGSYQLAIWDQWLDQIIQTQSVIVGNADVAMGDIPVLSWFTQYDQNIFMESPTKSASQRGIYRPDLGDKGISNVVMTTRYRDGGISNQTATDSNGNGLLAELFPLFNWYVTEADTTRFKQSGVNIIVDGGGQVDATGDGAGLYSSTYPTGGSSNRVEIPGAYSYGIQSFISQRNTINWGRVPYAPNENGGIQGTVVYSTTRPFDDQRYNVQTLWEPLVPRVTVNLYRQDKLPDGRTTLTKVDSTLTSSWDDWVGALNADGTQANMTCPGQLPAPAAGALPPFNTTQVDPFVNYTLGGDVNRCYDGFHNWNQVQPAPYDGRYAFPSAAYVKAHPLSAAQQAAGQTLVSLPPGQYVVEVVTPPGFEVVKEEDKNILNGDAFDAQVPLQFAGIANVFILPDQATLNNANPYNPPNADGIKNNATNNLGVTASSLTYPECVGILHRVPDYLSLFPQGGLVAPFAGQDRPLCDRKLVNLVDQSQASATFFVFTAVPMAAAGTGIILDDASSEFNAYSPDFGEKASVPFVPVSIKDFNGREIGRSYSDQWGAYNVMTPSSWLVNPPTPSGYGPNMLVTCMNDPGPIPDPSGAIDPLTGKVKMVTDPQYNAAYSNFCYTLPFMPGRTTYLDTPVLPIAAHAGGYHPADCAYPDTTPAILRVDSSVGAGPYLTTAGGTLTITALGQVQVPNPHYAGPFALPTDPLGSQRNIVRNYSFGATRGTVRIGNVNLSVATWTDTAITVNVPANTPTGQLVITNANGAASVDAVTVTIEDRAPKRVLAPSPEGSLPGAIQQAVDAADPGDLILIEPGTYSELVVMWKPVRLQGVGAASVIINAAKYPTQKIEAWRPMINSLFSIDALTGNSTGIAQVDPLPGQEITGGVVLLEPSVLGTEEGAGITVLAKNLPPNACSNGAQSTWGHAITDSNFSCAASRIDGLSVTGGDAGGGIYVNGWAHNLEISNNRVYGNAGAFNGGVRIGVPYLQNPAFPGLVENPNGGVSGTPTLVQNTIAGWGFDTGVKIHHNAITKNGVVEGPAGGGGAGGGISMCTGSDGYSVDHNWVCGNFSSSDGGGIGHIGYSQNGHIAFNQVLFNQSFQQTTATHGGGIAVVGEPALFGATVSPGTGNLTIDANVIRGNFAEAGHGGGVRLQQVNGADVAAFGGNPNRWHKVTMTNNIVDNNVAGWGGGGVSVSDAINTAIVNNTIAANDSAGIAGPVLSTTGTGTPVRGKPSPAGFSADPTSAQLLAAINGANRRAAAAVSQPANFTNNIIWKNRAFYFDTGPLGNNRLCNTDGGSGACKELAPQATTGACDNTALYWDLGVLGDLNAATPGVTPGATLNATAAPIQATTDGTRLVTVTTGPATVLVGTTVTISGFTGTGSGAYNGAQTVRSVASTATATTITYRPTGNGVSNANFASLGKSAVSVAYPPVNGPVLSPSYSVLTATAGYPGTGNSSADPQLANLYCNGARSAPELPGVINPPSPKGFEVAATLDEGNNYVNMRFGPLTLSTPGGVAVGNYHLAATGTASSAVDSGTTGVSTHDVDNQGRPQGAGWDIGADELAGPAPALGLSPASMDFGNQVRGTTSAAQTLTITNTGAAPLVFNATGVTISGNFNVQSTTCNGANLAVNASCVVDVRFAPRGLVGSKTGTLTLRDNAPGSPQTVALSGTAVNPVMATPNPLAFGGQTAGTTSATQLVTFTNYQAVPVTFRAINAVVATTLLGPAGEFVVDAGASTCKNSTQVPAGGSCVVGVQFKPAGATGSALGSRVGTLTLRSSAATQSVLLAGTAL